MDYDYLTRRMTEERERAAKADNEAARNAHLETGRALCRQLERLRIQDEPGMQAATA